MKHHIDNVLLQYLTTGQSQIGVGLTVKVYDAGTANLSTIYSDNGINAINQTTAPLITDVNGIFNFYAANGRYDIVVSGQGIANIVQPDVLLEDDVSVHINAQVGIAYTLAAADIATKGTLNTFSNAATITVTVPSDNAVPLSLGAKFDCVQSGIGKVTFVGAVGVTILSAGGNKSIATQYVGVSLIKQFANTWLLIGNLAP